MIGLIAFLFVFIALVLWACVAVGSRHDMPEPTAPRPIRPSVDHYDLDVESGTMTYHVVKTRADWIRGLCDEDLAAFFGWTNARKTPSEWLEWLKEEVDG